MRSASSGACSAFQQRVYALVRAVPAGRVTTYGALAKLLGSSPRAVGQALKANPFGYCDYPTEAAARRAGLVRVPCHRVVAARGLGGFTARGRRSMRAKRALLAQEGYFNPALREAANETGRGFHRRRVRRAHRE